MEKKKLIFLKSFLFKTFIVGILFAILLFFGTATFWDKWSSFLYMRFHVNEEELGKLVINSFLYLRFFLVFLILVPAISLHWLSKTID